LVTQVYFSLSCLLLPLSDLSYYQLPTNDYSGLFLPLSSLFLPLSSLFLPLSGLFLPLSGLFLPLSSLFLPLSSLFLPLSGLFPLLFTSSYLQLSTDIPHFLPLTSY